MLGEIIGAASGLLGGLFGQNSAEKQARQQIQLQKDFAQQGIRWKVADAKAAGINPLYALGANTTSFSPIGIHDSPMASALGNAGQDIGRAIEAKQTVGEREFTSRMQALQLQRGQLENAVLASQLARNNGPAARPPPMPGNGPQIISGQNTTPNPERFAGPVSVVPTKINATMPNLPHVEAGPVPDISFSRTENGWAPQYGENVADRMEDNIAANIGWAVRNIVHPGLFNNVGTRPPYRTKAGYAWEFNPITQEWHERKMYTNPFTNKTDRVKRRN